MMSSRLVSRCGFAGLLAGVLLLVSATTAQAISFQLAEYEVTVTQTDPGLVLWENSLLANPYVFNLSTVGETETVALFQVGTNEGSLNLDDLIPHEAEVEFSFSSPAPAFGGTSAAISGAFWWGNSFGYVLWNNPLTLSFGNGGLLGVALSNATFGLPGSATVYATFQLLQAPLSVPEPSTALLLGIGLAAALTARRTARARA